MTLKPPIQNQKTISGFTLVELMITITCIAIIGIMVVPSANDSGTRLKSAARRLIADIEYAQAASLGRGDAPCVVIFNTTDACYHLARVSDPMTPLLHPITHEDYVVWFGHGSARALRGVGYDSVDVGADDTLTYTPMGVLDTGENATVTLRCGDATLRIVINADTGEPTTP